MSIQSILSKFKFCLHISADLPAALRLMYDTKRFNSIYSDKQYRNTTNEAIAYPMKIAGRKRDIYMRLLNGDFNMFYEVLWAETYRVPAKYTGKPQTIVDLGANVGFASVFFADQYPGAKIISVEPSKGNFQLLKKNTATFTNIHPVHAAACPSPGTVPFFEDLLAYNSHIAHKGEEGYSVRAITLAEIMKEHNLQQIDLLKLDIEGAEEMLLAENTTWLQYVHCIITELHHPYNIEAFKKDLAPYNFEVLTPEESGLKMIIAFKK